MITQPVTDEATPVNSAATILQGVVRSFVQDPDAVEVETEVVDDETRFTLRVAPEDFDTVIGPAKRTIRSLRSIVSALGRRSGQRFALDCESEGEISS